jgi:hypothetical protein
MIWYNLLGDFMKKINFKLFQNNDEMSKLANIFIVISILFLAFYFITVLVTTENVLKESEIATIQYQEILASDFLNKSEKEYYVLVFDKNGINSELYNYYLTTYKEKEESLPVYIVDSKNIFNLPFIKEESDLVNGIFIDNTLLKIKDNKIEESYLTKEKIMEAYENLINPVEK